LLTWPDEQSIRSAPAALKARAMATASSGVMPPSTQSCAEMRTDIGLSAGQAARMPRTPPAGSAAGSPAAAVVVARWLVSGEMKLDSR
jgi:hypothetical protein